MCVKLPPRNLNPDPYPPHPISIYTYKVTTTPRMCGCALLITSPIKISHNIQEYKSLYKTIINLY